MLVTHTRTHTHTHTHAHTYLNYLPDFTYLCAAMSCSLFVSALVALTVAHVLHRLWKVLNPCAASVALFLRCIDAVPFLVVALLGVACRVLQLLLGQIDFDSAGRQDCGCFLVVGMAAAVVVDGHLNRDELLLALLMLLLLLLGDSGFCCRRSAFLVGRRRLLGFGDDKSDASGGCGFIGNGCDIGNHHRRVLLVNQVLLVRCIVNLVLTDYFLFVLGIVRECFAFSQVDFEVFIAHCAQ